MTPRSAFQLYAGALLLAAPLLASAASFNCASATSAVESMICADEQLSAMDDELAKQYRAARVAAPDPAAFKRETNQEWRVRARCTDRACLIAWYRHRSAQLSALLQHGQASPAPSTPVPPHDVQPTATVSPDDSNGLLIFVWLAAGVGFLVWVIRRLAAAGRRGAAAEAARTSSNARPSKESSRPATRISPAAKRSGRSIPTVWIAPGRTVTIADTDIPGGMLYVGSTLSAPDGSIEPAQIDPTLAVDSRPASPHERLFGYWPRYKDISEIARRAYLTWLARGRCDPEAEIGYVFLFFYGLERRVLVDARQDATARAEIPAILAEVERLRGIYQNRSFQSYSRSFLDYVIASGQFAKSLYEKEPPGATFNRGMPLLLRAGLGQCALDRVPVPATWALSWVRCEPNVSLPRAAARCAEQFDRQFLHLYAQRFAEGLKLDINRTKLKVSYRAASAGLVSSEFTSALGELPDVTTVVAPLKKLQKVIDETGESLESYSRFIGRHPSKANSVEATMLLPKTLWSDSVTDAVNALDGRVGTGMVVIKLGELLAAFGGGGESFSRDVLKNVFTRLHDRQIGVEPDVLAGARTPKPEDSVVLFRSGTLAGGETARDDASYAAVAVMLDLAITLANADGKISGREVQFLNRQVDTWVHVGESAQRRLRARLRLGIVYPPSLASLKSRVEPLPAAARAALGNLLVALAMVDGRLDPAEIRHLEKIYAVLDIERTVLYGQLHGTAASADANYRAKIDSSEAPAQSAPRPTPSRAHRESAGPSKAATASVALDQMRIAELQAETERVTALLSKVFEEEVPPPAPLVSEEQDEQSAGHASRLLGLDGEHSAFLRVLLTRSSWTRAELLDIAADMELMLDGALERINEAALERFDARIAEGDDPIEIDQNVMETVEA